MSSSTDNKGKTTGASRFKAPRAKWIRFAIWGTITILFAVWTVSGWWLLALPFFFDLFISRTLPWA